MIGNKNYESLIRQIVTNSNIEHEIHAFNPDTQIRTFNLYDERSQKFLINANTRQIIIPQAFSFSSSNQQESYVGVAGDHCAETIYFEIDRYFEGNDFAQCSCVIQYTNPKQKTDYFTVNPDTYIYSNDKDTLIFPWVVGGTATQEPGTLAFSVRFYKLNNDKSKFTYNWSTRINWLRIYSGIDAFAENDPDKEFENPLASQLAALQESIYNLDDQINEYNATMEQRMHHWYLGQQVEDGKINMTVSNTYEGNQNIPGQTVNVPTEETMRQILQAIRSLQQNGVPCILT